MIKKTLFIFLVCLNSNIALAEDKLYNRETLYKEVIDFLKKDYRDTTFRARRVHEDKHGIKDKGDFVDRSLKPSIVLISDNCEFVEKHPVQFEYYEDVNSKRLFETSLEFKCKAHSYSVTKTLGVSSLDTSFPTLFQDNQLLITSEEEEAIIAKHKDNFKALSKLLNLKGQYANYDLYKIGAVMDAMFQKVKPAPKFTDEELNQLEKKAEAIIFNTERNIFIDNAITEKANAIKYTKEEFEETQKLLQILFKQYKESEEKISLLFTSIENYYCPSRIPAKFIEEFFYRAKNIKLKDETIKSLDEDEQRNKEIASEPWDAKRKKSTMLCTIGYICKDAEFKILKKDKNSDTMFGSYIKGICEKHIRCSTI